MTENKKITIGIWVYAEPFRLQKTLDSIRAHTLEPFTLVLLPDGPDTVSAEALGKFRDIPQLATNRSLGAPACFNRLISYDTAEIVIFLECGSIVTAGWLEKFIETFNNNPDCGVVCPSTNVSWNEQRLPDAPGVDAAAQVIESYAVQISQRFQDTYRSLEPLYGLNDFCFAVRREVIEATGGADEDYTSGPCWEMDYSIRAARAGFKLIWACKAYVHRLPFSERRIQEERRLTEMNKRRYQDKFCRLNLENKRQKYCMHCTGDACEYFAPKDLIQVQLSHQVRVPDIKYQVDKSEIRNPASGIQNLKSETQNMPLVSCIMPTFNRRLFVSQAIKNFLHQEYPNKELIIVDDGTDKIQDLIPSYAHEQIKYIGLEQRKSIGYKRNMAVEQSRGEIIAHWDDDDWYHPSYLKELTNKLLQVNNKNAISGISGYLVYLLEESVLKVCRTHGIAGATFCYFKNLWEKNRYRDVNNAEDYFFLQDLKPSVIRIENPELFIVIRHGDHTWKQENGIDVDVYLRKLKNYSRHIDEIISREDHEFYAWARRELYTTTKQNKYSCRGLAEKPLVSAIMPTYNRRMFLPQAIKYFLRQDYPHKELVIVDDGTDKVCDLIPSHDQITYIRLEQKVSIGYKRNLALEKSRGEFIIHWDDDDWYAANRIDYQLQPLLEKKAEVSGLDTGFIYNILDNSFWTCEPRLHAMMFYADIHGGTIAYCKDLWERHAKYPDASLGEDAGFLRALSNKARITKLMNKNMYIYVRHCANAWEFICGNFINPNGWKKIEPPSFLTREDLNYYEEVFSKLSKDSNTYKRLADTMRSNRNYNDALRYYNRALELDPGNVWAWYDKGQTLEQLRRYEEALDAVLEADKLLHSQDNNRTWIHSELGKLYFCLGHKVEAKRQFEVALSHNRRNTIASEGMKKI